MHTHLPGIQKSETGGGLSFTRWHFWVWFRKDSTCFPEGILQYWPEAWWWRCGGGCQSRLMLMLFLPQRPHRSWKNRSLGPAIQSLEAVGPKLETPGGRGGGGVCLGDHSGNSIWFPPFNQVTQAWNAQLCQTEHSGCLGTAACTGHWCRERPTVSYCSLLNGSLDVTTRNYWRDK